MDYGKAAEKLMTMSDAVWMRHANPWSVWTRIASGPVWFFALWSFHWIGWRAIFLVILMAAWTWANPRVFPPPHTADSWATKGVLGERVWLNRTAIPIPEGFALAAHAISAISAVFMAIAVYGLITAEFWTAFAGWHGAIVAKIWFVDRMAWLWAGMQDADPRYQRWKFPDADLT